MTTTPLSPSLVGHSCSREQLLKILERLLLMCRAIISDLCCNYSWCIEQLLLCAEQISAILSNYEWCVEQFDLEQLWVMCWAICIKAIMTGWSCNRYWWIALIWLRLLMSWVAIITELSGNYYWVEWQLLLSWVAIITGMGITTDLGWLTML